MWEKRLVQGTPRHERACAPGGYWQRGAFPGDIASPRVAALYYVAYTPLLKMLGYARGIGGGAVVKKNYKIIFKTNEYVRYGTTRCAINSPFRFSTLKSVSHKSSSISHQPHRLSVAFTSVWLHSPGIYGFRLELTVNFNIRSMDSVNSTFFVRFQSIVKYSFWKWTAISFGEKRMCLNTYASDPYLTECLCLSDKRLSFITEGTEQLLFRNKAKKIPYEPSLNAATSVSIRYRHNKISFSQPNRVLDY